MIDRLRRRQARNLLTTLLLSTGTPMLTMGDEVRRTQLGNNNAYCQDGPLSWQPWDVPAAAVDLRSFTAALVHLRRRHPVFRQQAFFHGRTGKQGIKDLAWFGVDGNELDDAAWFDPAQCTLGMYLDGHGDGVRGSEGTRVVDDSFLLLLHTGADGVTVDLPGTPWAHAWTVVFDTADERPALAERPAAGSLPMTGRSAVLLRAVR